MLEKVSDHIESLMVCEEAIRRQFEISKEELAQDLQGNCDPLHEDEYEVAPGMINKYGNRALCLLTAECAAYCRFCTRRRLVSNIGQGHVDRAQVNKWAEYLSRHPEVSEVILSGGDPFIVDNCMFGYVLNALSEVESIKVLRIGTRAPVSDPSLISCCKLGAIQRVEQPIYVGIHFEHPTEITHRTVKSIKDLISAGAILYSQSVFLKGVNDDYETLYELFSRLVEIGVRPYYIYRCDPVPGAMHFIVEPYIERQIMTRLRRNLSGLACPTYVIDSPDGFGKVPVPLDFWDGDKATYTDFEGKRHFIE